MEIIDIVDANDNVVRTVAKGEVVQEALFSRVSFVVLLNQENELYLQQRKSTKKSYPLYWSGSAAGHVQSGESYLEAAERETFEELGVKTQLTEVGKFTSIDDKEIVTVFVGRSDGPYVLEDASIEKAANFSLEELRSSSSMDMTSYIKAAIPMVEGFIKTTA